MGKIGLAAKKWIDDSARLRLRHANSSAARTGARTAWTLAWVHVDGSMARASAHGSDFTQVAGVARVRLQTTQAKVWLGFTAFSDATE